MAARIPSRFPAGCAGGDRQQELAHLSQLASSDGLTFRLSSDHARIQQLTQQGLWKPKFLRLYVTQQCRAVRKLKYLN